MQPDWKSESGESFEQHAENSLRPVYQWFLKDLELAYKKSIKGLDVLEIGCGPGFMNEQFEKAGAKRIFELDLSPGMLEKAQSRCDLSRTLLIQADAAAIPLKNASVDIVFSRGSIFFWTEIERCFAEIRRIMKPGALAFIGGGYGLSTPEAVVEPILKRKKSGAGKKSIPRLDLDKLILIARKSFENATIQQAPRRGFWLKCNN